GGTAVAVVPPSSASRVVVTYGALSAALTSVSASASAASTDFLPYRACSICLANASDAFGYAGVLGRACAVASASTNGFMSGSWVCTYDANADPVATLWRTGRNPVFSLHARFC